MTAGAVVVAATRLWDPGVGVDISTPSEGASILVGGPDQIEGVTWSTTGTSVAAGGRDVVVGRPSEMVVLDAASGRERWHYRVDDGWVSSAVDGRRNVVVVQRGRGGDEDELAAFDLESGERRWRRRDVAGEVRAVVDGLAILWDYDAPGFTAIRIEDGKVAWRLPRQSFDVGCPESWRRSGDLLVGSTDCAFGLVALDAETGEEVWQSDLDGASVLPADEVVVVDGVYVAPALVPDAADENLRDGLVAVGTSTGEELWRYQGEVSAGPVVVGDTVVVATDGSPDDDSAGPHELRGLDPRTGQTVWSTDVGALVPSPAAVALTTDVMLGYLVTAPEGGSGGGDGAVVTFDSHGEVQDTAPVPTCTDPCTDGFVVDVDGLLVAAGGRLVAGSGVVDGERSALLHDGDGGPGQIVALGPAD